MKTILQVCAFGAPNAGNFIASLLMLEAKMKTKGYCTIYAFPEKAKDKKWCEKLCSTNKIYFLPEANARILPSTYLAMKRIYKENEITIAHSHFELYDMPVALMAPKNVKVFWHLHDALKNNYEKADGLRKILTKIQYSRLWKKVTLLSVSEEHGNYAASLGFPSAKIQYFPNGINTERIKCTPDEKANASFLMFGWDITRKGVDLALAAAKKLTTPCIIRIVGEKSCEDYIAHNNTPYIQFCQPVEDVNDLYKETTAFLHISRAEGLSYALLEVIYAGVPVICSNISENKFAAQFRNVFFVESENEDEIAKQIERLSSMHVICKKADIQYNRKLIESKYSLEAWCRRLSATYIGEVL